MLNPPPLLRVLCVDDDRAFHSLLRIGLGRHGIKVTTASNGAEAIALFRDGDETFDAIVSDNDMPEMGG